MVPASHFRNDGMKLATFLSTRPVPFSEDRKGRKLHKDQSEQEMDLIINLSRKKVDLEQIIFSSFRKFRCSNLSFSPPIVEKKLIDYYNEPLKAEGTKNLR